MVAVVVAPSAAVSALTTVAITNASHQSSGGSLGPAIFQLVGIVAVVVYIVVKSVSDGRKEHDDYMKRFSRDAAREDSEVLQQQAHYRYGHFSRDREAKLFANFDKIEYVYDGEWYKVGTGPLPMADWTDLWRVSLITEPPEPLYWRYPDGSAVFPESVYEYDSPAK